MSRSVALALSLVCLQSVPVLACTNIFASPGQTRLVATNLDCDNVFPRVWFCPPVPGQHGRFCYGTDENARIAEGGVNDQGLFIGVNALDQHTGWAPDPDRPDWEQWEGWFESGVPDGILAKCASVEEALTIFRRYNLLTLAHVKFLLADRSGASAIVEWHDGELVVLPRGASDFQVSTNFVTSGFPEGEAPCYRHNLAARMLAERGRKVDASFLRTVLSATHLEFQTPTVLSAIFDLASGEIRLHYFHYFEEEIVFDLRRELEAGPHALLVADLVEVKPYVAKVYEDFRR